MQIVFNVLIYRYIILFAYYVNMYNISIVNLKIIAWAMQRNFYNLQF